MQQLDFFEIIEKPTLVCPVCEKIFEKTTHNKICCSRKCIQKFHNQKRIYGVNRIYDEKTKKTNLLYYQKNKEIILKKNKLDYLKNKEKRNEQQKQYRLKNKEKIKERQKQYRLKNKEKRKKYDLINKEKIKEWTKQYRKENRKKINERRKKRLQTDINYKIAEFFRTRIREILLNQKTMKSAKTAKLLGCSWDEARIYIQSQFKEGMTWDNHGMYGWHIDHIIPCASFDLKDPEQQKKCFHYTNLQPLWAHENLSKGAKIE